MRYLCVHCDHRFEVDGETPPVRCPACMRAKGLEPLRDQPAKVAKPAPRRARLLGGAALLLLVAGAGAFYALRDGPVRSSSVPSAAALKAQLAAEQVDAGPLAALLEANDAIEAFAEQSAAGKDGDVAKVEAVYEALRKRAGSQAYVPWSLGELRKTPVLTAAQTLPLVQKSAGRAQLYPLEVTALAVAALRTLDVPARIAELTDLKGRSAPLDPSGYLGYFVVALPIEGGAPRLFDVYGGQKLDGATHALLSDAAAVGAALALRALHENTYLADPKQALESSSAALRLASSLPSVRTVRGVVMLTEKMVEQGLQEFQAARELRGDAPRLHNVATVMLVTGEVEKAQAVVSGALERSPDFAGAHATLGMLHMMMRDPDAGFAELQRAEKLSPQLSTVQWALAEYFMQRGDRDEALARARRAYDISPSFDGKLRLAALLRHASRYDEMRRLAAELVAQAPAYRREELRGLLTTILGATAFDAQAADNAAPDDFSDVSGTDLKLDAPGPVGLSQGQNPPKLRLSEPGGKLKLQLGGK